MENAYQCNIEQNFSVSDFRLDNCDQITLCVTMTTII
jgi:hypothetical protein